MASLEYSSGRFKCLEILNGGTFLAPFWVVVLVMGSGKNEVVM
jgi:hypothetical protein